MKLDYSIQSPQERNEYVKKICEEQPEEINSSSLEAMADYLIFAMDKEERKKKAILTENRMVTINRRETSYQGLAEKLENGEDGIYNMISSLGKNALFTQKDCGITEKDIEEVPGLKELRDAIAATEEKFKTATGRSKYLLKKQLIQMRQDQYILKNEYYKPFSLISNISSGINAKELKFKNFDEVIEITPEGDVVSNAPLSLYNPLHISALLCNYSKLKVESNDQIDSDLYYIMDDLDKLIDKTLKDKYPLLYNLLVYKINGLSNQEIQARLEKKYNIKHSTEYISSLWRNKIPKLLSEQNQKDYLIWYYTNVKPGKWKKCNRCGQIKLANHNFFSKNSASKDGWYSICKECRKKRG